MRDDERRRWRRLRSELPLQLHLTDDAGSGYIRSAVGSHLNPEGIFVQLADPPALGAKVRVTLNAEGSDGVLSAEGVVVDRVTLDAASARPPGVGIRIERKGPGWDKLYAWLVE
jgi:Tfp pilus assembly protein PilZ